MSAQGARVPHLCARGALGATFYTDIVTHSWRSCTCLYSRCTRAQGAAANRAYFELGELRCATSWHVYGDTGFRRSSSSRAAAAWCGFTFIYILLTSVHHAVYLYRIGYVQVFLDCRAAHTLLSALASHAPRAAQCSRAVFFHSTCAFMRAIRSPTL